MSIDDIKKMLAESTLPEEQKKKFSELIDEMNEEEKMELIKIIEVGKTEKMEHEERANESIVKLNTALDKHLKNTAREENNYIRNEFEKLEKKEEEPEIQILEEEIKKL